jgi:LysR family transcriptional regulator for metE and metH
VHLEVRHLRLVAAIADAGGVTRAGKVLFLTQSALSHQLRDIERRLGAALFVRAGRRMVLTPAGERLLESARTILRDLERAEAEISARAAGGPTGLLRVATECYTCYHWLPPVLEGFRAAWPGVELRLVPEATRRPLASLKVGDLDLAIVGHRVDQDPPTIPGRRLGTTTLFDDELVAIVAPSHHLAQRKHIDEQDFADEHVLLYNLRDEESTLLNDVLRPAGVRPARLSRIELTEAIVELVKAGMGIAMMARWAVAPHLQAGTLVALPITKRGLHRRWTAVYRVDAISEPFMVDFAKRVGRFAFPARRQPLAESRSRRARPAAKRKRPTRAR